MQRLYDLISSHEDRLIQRILAYAKERGYTRYTSTLEEAWRMSVAGLSAPLLKALREQQADLELGPDDRLGDDPIAAFGILEAKRHRERGISLGMFLGLMVYYEQAYIDLIRQAGFDRDYEEQCRHFVRRFFDRVQIGLCVDWATAGDEGRLSELQGANRLLTNEKNKYLTIFESLANPLILLDADSRVENMNHAAAELVRGVTVPGAPYYGGRAEGPAPDTGQARPGREDGAAVLPWLLDELESFGASGAPQCRFEKDMLVHGEGRSFEVALARMLDVSEKFAGTVVILNETTERKRHEQDVLRAKEEWERTFDATPDLIAILDTEHRIVRLNRAMAAKLEIGQDEAVGQYCYDLVHGSDRPPAFCPHVLSMQDGKEHTAESYEERFDGTYLVSTSPMRNGDGELIGSVHVARDISELKRAQEILRDAHAELERRVRQGTAELEQTVDTLQAEVHDRMGAEGALEKALMTWQSTFRAISDGLWILDMDGRIVESNGMLERLLGLPNGGEPLVGVDCCRAFACTPLQQEHCPVQQMKRTGQRSSVEVECAEQGVWLHVTVDPIRDKSGAIVGAVHIARDITARKRIEEELGAERRNLEQSVGARTQELRESLRRLEEANLQWQLANRHKSEFLSSMSHELRTPLNAVLGFADLLRGQFFGPLNEKQLDYVDQIDESGKHLLSLINDLLDMAKVDAGAMELELEEFPPEEVIETTVAMMKTQFRKEHLNVSVQIDPAVGSMSGDRRKCRQIMLNLLSNAVKYSHQGGRIVVRVTPDKDGAVRVEVSDTGIGIAPEEQERIFSEFYQADRVRDQQLGGTGIGLPLTQRLVGLHGGRIGVESEPGKGSTFWFVLPRAEAGPAGRAEEEAAEAAPPGLRGRRILVAEDDEVNLAMIVDMLSTHDHDVVVARNGQQAIDLAQAQRPEVILMDLRMPHMDGLEATRRLRAMPEFADVPIIAVTASAGPDAEERSRAAGCTDHLAKPLQSAALFGALRRHLHEREPGTM